MYEDNNEFFIFCTEIVILYHNTKKDGGRCRIRTYDPLGVNEVL